MTSLTTAIYATLHLRRAPLGGAPRVVAIVRTASTPDDESNPPSYDRTQEVLHDTEQRHHEEQLRYLAETVSDYAIFMLDPKGHVVSWNAGAERIKGYTEEEILGRHFSAFYCPDEAAAGLPGQ